MSGPKDEQPLGRVADARLLKRLLAYARPYKWIIALSISLLLVITVADLAGPYLIKKAIDDHINGIEKPMINLPDASPKMHPVPYHGLTLVRVNRLNEMPPGDIQRYQILSVDKRCILIKGMITEKEEKVTLEPAGGGDHTVLVKTSAGQTLTGTILTDGEVDAFRRQDMRGLMIIAVLYFTLLVLGMVLNFAQIYTLRYTGQHIIANMRQEVFAHIQSLPFSFFDRNPVGRIVTRVTNDTEALNDMYANVLINLFRDLFILIGITAIMIHLNLHLALLSFALIPVIYAITLVYRRYARAANRDVRTRLAKINATLNEHLSGMRIIQIFRREKQELARFQAINEEYNQASLRELRTGSVFRPLMDLVYNLGLALLIWFGGAKVMDGAITFGVLYAFIDYINRFFQPIKDLAEKYTSIQSGLAASERIFLLLDEKDNAAVPSHPVDIGRFKGEIRFDHVWFAYNENEWVLKDITFSVNPGEVVAFVGATGAGKSSIIQLLSRFYEIQEGSIAIDGIDIRRIDQKRLRAQIGVVLQDVFLFSGDIASNIRLNRELSDEGIMAIARQVNADRFISLLPGGLHEPVAERGVTLSAGERQLLSFARTLAFDPSILVLDEATANIDTQTERLIQAALQRLIKGRTTIIVAHRLSTIQHADKIIVLDKGEIKEMGNHQQLLKQQGLYYQLYSLQYKEQAASLS
jgi:ATP-binding cassette subfamily B protein/subfamily B ATP-binding cassette protein MsbA